MERLDAIQRSLKFHFLISLSLCLPIADVFSREKHPNQLSVWPGDHDWDFTDAGVFTAFAFVLQWVDSSCFADIFYVDPKEFNTSRIKILKASFIILSFSMLLLSNYDLLSLFVKIAFIGYLYSVLSVYTFCCCFLVKFLSPSILSSFMISFMLFISW